MTYAEWVTAQNMTDFKNQITARLATFGYSETQPVRAALESLIDAVGDRYSNRSIYGSAQAFKGFYRNELVNALPAFVANLKKFAFYADFADSSKFGVQTTTSYTGDERYTSNSSDRETFENSKTIRGNLTDNRTTTDRFTSEETDKETGNLTRTSQNTNESNSTGSDKTTSEVTNRETNENSKTNNETTNKNDTNTNIEMEGARPLYSSTPDAIDEAILAYGKNVNKQTTTSSETANGSETTNTTLSGTNNKTETIAKTNQNTQTSNGSETDTSTNTLTINKTNNDNRTSEGTQTRNDTETDSSTSSITGTKTNEGHSQNSSTKNVLDWQAAVEKIASSDYWQLKLHEFLNELEYLFVGVSYYAF